MSNVRPVSPFEPSGIVNPASHSQPTRWEILFYRVIFPHFSPWSREHPHPSSCWTRGKRPFICHLWRTSREREGKGAVGRYLTKIGPGTLFLSPSHPILGLDWASRCSTRWGITLDPAGGHRRDEVEYERHEKPLDSPAGRLHISLSLLESDMKCRGNEYWLTLSN